MPPTEDAVEGTEPTLVSGTVEEVKARVGDEVNLIRDALALEKDSDKPRSSLVSYLEDRLSTTGKTIVFEGPEFTVRQLSKVDFERAGVDSPSDKPVEWSKFPGGNDHTVDVSDWSDDQVQAVLSFDSRFKVREG